MVSSARKNDAWGRPVGSRASQGGGGVMGMQMLLFIVSPVLCYIFFSPSFSPGRGIGCPGVFGDPSTEDAGTRLSQNTGRRWSPI